ncbi:MAG: rane bound O-acyl transferase family protein [Edaphobacter sp.]|nr:rane bound O-acyl transferase family protein [Edaphobacter sp.]
MDTASLQFLFFGLAVALVSNFSRARAWRSIVLLFASFIFLGLLAHGAVVLLPLAGFLLFGYGGLILLQRGWSRSMVWTILAVLLAYIWLKKYTFLPASILLHHYFFALGLSYVFFRVLHLLIETGDGNEKRRVGFGAYLLYTLNFATLVSGPIQRYDEFARDQFAEEPIALGPRTIGLQLERIVRGFFKVNVLAVLLNDLQQYALAQMFQPLPLWYKVFAAFRLAVVYPLFLYANFSGYIDLVIALARLMRVRLPENFDRPFSATSFLDFWSRWHMTLSTWFKTYVYNPLLLALMRRISSLSLQPLLGVFCFSVTFFLVGVWHGRTSEFVMYGVLQGGGVATNKLWQVALTAAMGRKGYKNLATRPVYIALGRGLTFSWFAFTLFWFWADWKQIDRIFTALGVMQWLGVWLAIWLFATIVLAAWEGLREALLSIRTSEGPVLTNRYARVVYASALGLIAVLITVLLNQPAPDIVYKAF